MKGVAYYAPGYTNWTTVACVCLARTVRVGECIGSLVQKLSGHLPIVRTSSPFPLPFTVGRRGHRGQRDLRNAPRLTLREYHRKMNVLHE